MGSAVGGLHWTQQKCLEDPYRSQLRSIPKRSNSKSGLHFDSGFDVTWSTFPPYLCSLQRATHHRPTISRTKLSFKRSHIRIPYSPSLINRITAISTVKRLSLSVFSPTPLLLVIIMLQINRVRSERKIVI